MKPRGTGQRTRPDRSNKDLSGYQYASGWDKPEDDPLDLTRNVHPALRESSTTSAGRSKVGASSTSSASSTRKTTASNAPPSSRKPPAQQPPKKGARTANPAPTKRPPPPTPPRNEFVGKAPVVKSTQPSASSSSQLDQRVQYDDEDIPVDVPWGKVTPALDAGRSSRITPLPLPLPRKNAVPTSPPMSQQATRATAPGPPHRHVELTTEPEEPALTLIVKPRFKMPTSPGALSARFAAIQKIEEETPKFVFVVPEDCRQRAGGVGADDKNDGVEMKLAELDSVLEELDVASAFTEEDDLDESQLDDADKDVALDSRDSDLLSEAAKMALMFADMTALRMELAELDDASVPAPDTEQHTSKEVREEVVLPADEFALEELPNEDVAEADSPDAMSPPQSPFPSTSEEITK